MNKKLVQKVKSFFGKPGVAVLLVVIVVGFGAIQFATDNNYEIQDNQTDSTVNESVLNQSEYYDTEDKVCQSPETNMSNVSQLKACVSNQTS